MEISLDRMEENLDLFILDACQKPVNCLFASTNENLEVETILLSASAGSYYIVVDAPQEGIISDYLLRINCSKEEFPNLSCRDLGVVTQDGAELNISDIQIANTGTFAIPSQLEVYLSTDSNISDEDYLIATVDVPFLSASSDWTVPAFSVNLLDLGVPEGTYFVGLVLDSANELEESNEMDNICFWEDFKVEIKDEILSDAPNLICDDLGQLNLSNSYLSIFNLSVKNIGSERAENSYVGYYLSQDQAITTDDIYLGESFVRALPAGAKSVEYFSARLSNIPIGSYYIGLIVDYREEVEESTRRDNVYLYEDKLEKTTTPNLSSIDLGGQSEMDFNVSPNPSSGQFRITLNDELLDSELSIEVFGLDGKIFLAQRLTSNKNRFDLSTFTEGIYYLRLKNSEQTSVKKVMIVK